MIPEQNGSITPAQKRLFEEKGVLGSHLENILRGKGFNRRNVRDIIKRTDPRTQDGG